MTNKKVKTMKKEENYQNQNPKKYGKQLENLANHVEEYSQTIRELILKRLANVMSNPTSKSNSFEVEKPDDDWPNYLKTLRNNLTNIKNNLEYIEEAIEKRLEI